MGSFPAISMCVPDSATHDLLREVHFNCWSVPWSAQLQSGRQVSHMGEKYAAEPNGSVSGREQTPIYLSLV